MCRNIPFPAGAVHGKKIEVMAGIQSSVFFKFLA
jgi:hypothetical protein